MCAPHPTARAGGDAEFRSMHPDLPSPGLPRRVGAMKWLLALLGFALVMVINVVGPGCGTLMNQAAVGDRTRPYGGVRKDFLIMAEKPATIPVFVVDLPLSIVGDTLWLIPDLRAQDKPDTVRPPGAFQEGVPSSQPQ